jgi:ribose/xylose/arabinose/galactoside ABC-type transport system permease subunit
MRNLHPQTLRLIALAIVLVGTVLFFSSQIDNYFTPRMLNRIATSVAVILPIAIGQAMVVMTRNIDLSVGSIVGIVAYIVGDFPWDTCGIASGIGAQYGACAWRVLRVHQWTACLIRARSIHHCHAWYIGIVSHISGRIFRCAHNYDDQPTSMVG